MGQKWGVRHGPPYPLDESQYSGAEKRMVRNANKEVAGYMKGRAQEYAKEEYDKRYGKDENVNDLEYWNRMRNLSREFERKPEYQQIMEQKYSEVLEREQARLEVGRKNTLIALGIVGGLLVAGGIANNAINAKAHEDIAKTAMQYRDRRDMRRVNAREAAAERKHEFNLAYGIGAKRR